MTVAELKEALDDYGDHLQVRIRVRKDDGDDRLYPIVALDTEEDNTDRETCVVVDFD